MFIYSYYALNLQTAPDGTQSEIKGATAASYTLTNDDIGFLISVSCEPVRSDFARGPTVLSEQIGPVVPGEWLIYCFKPTGSLLKK